jgi:5'-nucleotidase (lipoprotein e(P4) family)
MNAEEGSQPQLRTAILELLKQLIGLAAGVIALSAAFADRLAPHFGIAAGGLAASWLMLITSLFFGLRAMSALVKSLKEPDFSWAADALRRNARFSKDFFFYGILLFAASAFWTMALDRPRQAESTHSVQAPPPTLASASGHLEVKYVRDSEEYSALAREVYRLAGDAVVSLSTGLPPRQWAVVLDVDETALDNSVYQLERAAYGIPFDQSSWRAWVKREQARAVPGAKSFIDTVRRFQGRVAWITDREASADKDMNLIEATSVNLKSAGLWEDGDLLCLRKQDSKMDRRRQLFTGTGPCSWPTRPGKPVRVLLFVGDQMGDFPAANERFTDPSTPWDTEFGRHFFLLPNPMYGRWTSSVNEREPK